MCKLFDTMYKILTNIRVAFQCTDKKIMEKIIASMICPRLEYAPMKKDVRNLERIQRATTRMVPEVKELTYEDKLKEMGLPTLHTHTHTRGLPMLQDRRERGDLITL